MDEELPRMPGMREAALRRRRETVGALADHRRASGLSQTELAARMGTSQSSIARLEAGEVDPRMSTLERYAEALGGHLDVSLRFEPVRTGEVHPFPVADPDVRPFPGVAPGFRPDPGIAPAAAHRPGAAPAAPHQPGAAPAAAHHSGVAPAAAHVPGGAPGAAHLPADPNEVAPVSPAGGRPHAAQQQQPPTVVNPAARPSDRRW